MSLVPLALVVLAAFIHATWNLLSKRAADAGPAFVFVYNLVACVVYLPWVVWVLVHNAQNWNWPVAARNAARQPMMTKVRMNVAKSELTFSTPTLAKIAVSAANTAESTAQICQEVKVSGFMKGP